MATDSVANELDGSLDDPSRIAFLDGMRGATALYVVLYHCYFMEVTAFDIQHNFTLAERLRIHWLGFGEEAMAVFVAISGYCLMRPVLANGGHLKEGIGRFLLHRAKRLLIPYFIVLIALLALMKCGVKMERINVDLFEKHFPQVDNFSVGNLASHFLLFDNLKHTWKFSIDPPAWGVATMWWMYVLFALVLLPIWRRLGGVVTAIVVLIVTLIPHFVRNGIGDVASPWFIGIFTIGMAAAGQSFSRGAVQKMPRTLWLLTAVFLLTVCAYIGMMYEEWMWNRIFAIDILVGCAAACFIVYGAERVKADGGLSFPLNVLETKPLAALGRISYSLFLVHFPTLWMIHAHVTAPMQASPITKLAWQIGLGVPASLIVAAGFYFAVERPFAGRSSAATDKRG